MLNASRKCLIFFGRFTNQMTNPKICICVTLTKEKKTLLWLAAVKCLYLPYQVSHRHLNTYVYHFSRLPVFTDGADDGVREFWNQFVQKGSIFCWKIISIQKISVEEVNSIDIFHLHFYHIQDITRKLFALRPMWFIHPFFWNFLNRWFF